MRDNGRCDIRGIGSGTRGLSATAVLMALSLPIALLTWLPAGASTLASPASPGSLPPAGWPLFFEPGSAANHTVTNFLARGPNYQLVLAPAEADFILRKPELAPPSGSVRRDQSLELRSAAVRAVRISFPGANSQALISGADQMEGKVNYLVGNNPAHWRAQVPMFAKVEVKSLYPGVDLIYYGSHRQLEYDFRLDPGTDPSQISLRFQGVDGLSITPAGELIVRVGQDELRQHPPVVYQLARGVRRHVPGRYQIKEPHTVSFAIGSYDRHFPLVIDPVFSYATFFGGNGGDTGLSIKVDQSGSVYLAGETLSTQFPWGIVGAPFQSQLHSGAVNMDAFVAKLDNTGSRLLYFTYLGGSRDDGAYDLAIDPAGNAYLTGFTVSPDFPTKNALFSHISGAPDPTFGVYATDAFVTELNTNGSDLVYSTYLGGSARDLGSAIAVDPAGYAYVAGYTYSTNFPIVNGGQRFLAGDDDAFVAKLAPGGTNLFYSTYLGGIAVDEAQGIAADADGFAYVTGYTSSTNFPITANAVQTNLNGTGVEVLIYDAFVTKIAPDGGSLVYSTFFGGVQNDFGYRIALDPSGNAYVTGATESTNFPHANVSNLTVGETPANVINFDAFLTKFDPAGIPVYSDQFGGTYNDAGWDVAVDAVGRAFVVGITRSTNFPVYNALDLFRTTNSGWNDVFVVAFNTNGDFALYSGYLGGGTNDYGYAIAVDAEANAYISGSTLSAGFPTTAGAFRPTLDGTSDAFLAKIRLRDPMLSALVLDGTIQVSWPATAPDYGLQSTQDLSPPQVWTALPQAPVLIDGEYRVNLATTNATTLFRLHRP